MNILLPLGLTVLVLTIVVTILAFGTSTVFFIGMIRADPTIMIKWDRERLKEEERKQPKLAEAMNILYTLAFWYINPPTFFYYRYVKKNRFATLTNPKGKK